MNYSVKHTNFGASKDFRSFDEAIAYARKACFEANIYCGTDLFAVFSPITGLRTFFN